MEVFFDTTTDLAPRAVDVRVALGEPRTAPFEAGQKKPICETQAVIDDRTWKLRSCDALQHFVPLFTSIIVHASLPHCLADLVE